MSSAATRPATPGRPANMPVRPSGVMPAFHGKVSLPTPAVRPAPVLRVARPADDDKEWQAALAAAKQRALAEEREWQAAVARAQQVAQEEREWAALRARALAEEEREWAALRARAHQHAAPRRVIAWP